MCLNTKIDHFSERRLSDVYKYKKRTIHFVIEVYQNRITTGSLNKKKQFY